MAGHQLIIGDGDSGRVFSSKKDAKMFFKNMLSRYRNKQEISSDDAPLLRVLLERHPEAVEKIGCGVKRFYRDGTGMGTDCFWIERDDGSKTDFSYISCVDAKSNSLYQEFAEACRQAVQADLDHAKVRHFEVHGNGEGKVRCEVSGEMVGLKESHLDHAKPMTFQVIVQTFITANKIEIALEMLSEPADHQFVTTFVDEDLARRFREYHRGVMQLRIIKAKENLSLGGSERMRKPKRPVLFE